MKVFRITKRKYAEDLTGKGAELYGGRWNPIGVPALYTSENRSLAALELLVHLPKSFLPPGFVVLTIDIPSALEKEIITLPADSLDANWNAMQVDSWTQETGRRYFQDLKALGIKVPSTIVNEEFNIILNPLHAHFREVTIELTSAFSLDQRLFE